MGLAPYGKPIYKEIILDKLLDLKSDGSFTMNMDYFAYCHGLTMTTEKFSKLFGGPPRKSESQITEREMNLASSIQAVTEEIVLRMASYARDLTGKKKPLLIWRSCPKLRCQWKIARFGSVRSDLGSTCFGRCRRSSWLRFVLALSTAKSG